MIPERQQELDALYAELIASRTKHPHATTSLDLDDSTLLDLAHRAKDGSKFAALWRGDTSGYPSHSEADLALCNLLAFWTGNDIPRMDRLFRQSGLYREEKWDRPDESYARDTLENALQREVYAPRCAPVEADALTMLQFPELKADVVASLDLIDESVMLSYRYAFSLTPERIDAMTPDELKAACKEYQSLVNGILSCVYNRYAKPTTRLVAIDLLASAARRTARALSNDITEPAPVCISNDYGVAARLGVTRNTVSSAYNVIEEAALIVRQREEDLDSGKEHLRIGIQPEFLTHFANVTDKQERKLPEHHEFKPSGTGKLCNECESGNIDIICRDCGSVEHLGKLPHEQRSEPCPKFEQSSPRGEEDYPKSEQLPADLQPSAQPETQETSKGFPTEWTSGDPCDKCGCPLYRQMAEYTVCVRCYPQRGYDRAYELLSKQYPRKKKVTWMPIPFASTF